MDEVTSAQHLVGKRTPGPRPLYGRQSLAVTDHPCGECRHWRYSAGQEVVTAKSVRLDINDLGWDRYTEMREMGRCGAREDLLAHRLATCEKWSGR